MGNSTSKTCSFDGCSRPLNARKLCSGHYQQMRRGEDLTPIAPRASYGASLQERLNARTSRSDGCWEWLGATNDVGYGQFRVRRTVYYAHRVSWEIANGRSIPPGLVIDHICHNAACVRPEHLQAVTQKENAENATLSRANTSGARGVCRGKRGWEARVTHHGRLHVRYSATFEQARLDAIALRAELFTNSLTDMIA